MKRFLLVAALAALGVSISTESAEAGFLKRRRAKAVVVAPAPCCEAPVAPPCCGGPGPVVTPSTPATDVAPPKDMPKATEKPKKT